MFTIKNVLTFILALCLFALTGCMTALGLLVDHRNLEENAFSAYPIDAKLGKRKDANSFIYEEVLANNSSMPFKIVYSKRRLESPVIGDIEESRNYSIKDKFTTDTLIPNSEVSRKDVDFSIPSAYGKTTQVTEYCGYYLTSNGNQLASNAKIILEMKPEKFTCSLYKMTIDPGHAKLKKAFRSIFNIMFWDATKSILDYYDEGPCE